MISQLRHLTSQNRHGIFERLQQFSAILLPIYRVFSTRPHNCLIYRIQLLIAHIHIRISPITKESHQVPGCSSRDISWVVYFKELIRSGLDTARPFTISFQRVYLTDVATVHLLPLIHQLYTFNFFISWVLSVSRPGFLSLDTVPFSQLVRFRLIPRFHRVVSAQRVRHLLSLGILAVPSQDIVPEVFLPLGPPFP